MSDKPNRTLVLFNATTVARASLQELEHLELVLAASVEALAKAGLQVGELEAASQHAKSARVALESAVKVLEQSK